MNVFLYRCVRAYGTLNRRPLGSIWYSLLRGWEASFIILHEILSTESWYNFSLDSNWHLPFKIFRTDFAGSIKVIFHIFGNLTVKSTTSIHNDTWNCGIKEHCNNVRAYIKFSHRSYKIQPFVDLFELFIYMDTKRELIINC